MSRSRKRSSSVQNAISSYHATDSSLQALTGAPRSKAISVSVVDFMAMRSSII
ncbi:MAG TPA: hypothetical protein PLW54_10110 [Bacteroidia bacterium]|nr:hypothetical protein [Bacteroidia bacterium]